MKRLSRLSVSAFNSGSSTLTVDAMNYEEMKNTFSNHESYGKINKLFYSFIDSTSEVAIILPDYLATVNLHHSQSICT